MPPPCERARHQGVGETDITGSAGAVANAVWPTTEIRLRPEA